MKNITYWQTIAHNDFAIPATDTALELLPDLLVLLRSENPVLRDDLAYSILAHWLSRGYFTNNTKLELIVHLEAELQCGLGEVGTKTVFGRSFACLILATIVGTHHQNAFLEEAQMQHLRRVALAYLAAEKDLRGRTLEFGWAHAVAHCADWLDELVPSASAVELQQMLEGLANKTLVETVYLHNEEDRLAFAAARVIAQGLLTISTIEAWTKNLLQLPKSDVATHNARGFLRCVYLHLLELSSGANFLSCIPKTF